MRPFLKWAGNKYQIIEKIKALLPQGKRLIEPFTGTAAVFLNTEYSDYILADKNSDLIMLFTYLKEEKAKFITYTSQFFDGKYNNSTAFYDLRDSFNNTKDSRLKSALFIYLNKHAFNGLCRYNAKGLFNAPFGKYKKAYFPGKEMHFFSEKAQNAVLRCADFTETMYSAEPGDVVYCDPPYVPLSKTSNFTSYSTNGFNLEQQNTLANLAEELSKKKIPVIISNHDTEFTRQAYINAQIMTFDVQRLISCKGNSRLKASEILALFNEK